MCEIEESNRAQNSLEILSFRWNVISLLEGQGLGRRSIRTGVYHNIPEGLRKVVKLINYERPTDDSLKSHYESCARVRSSKYPRSIEKTSHERIVADRVAKANRLKYLKSVWIGLWCFDLFLPTIEGSKGEYRYSGLLLEIDGPIHNGELKMRKDETGRDFIHNELGLLICSIDNASVRTFSLKDIVSKFTFLKRQDSRSLKRMWRRIYWATILAEMRTDLLKLHFGIDIPFVENAVLLGARTKIPLAGGTQWKT